MTIPPTIALLVVCLGDIEKPLMCPDEEGFSLMVGFIDQSLAWTTTNGMRHANAIA